MTNILFLISVGILIFGVVKILGSVGASSLPSLPSIEIRTMTPEELEKANDDFKNGTNPGDLDVRNPLYRETTGWH